MVTKDKLNECMTLANTAFKTLDKLAVSGTQGCTVVATVADCLVKIYKLAEELEKEADDVGNDKDNG